MIETNYSVIPNLFRDLTNRLFTYVLNTCLWDAEINSA